MKSLVSALLGRARRMATCVLFGGFALALAPATASADTTTFNSTGAEQTFTMPAGVTSVHVVAVGGKGGSAAGTAGGFGAQAAADLTVTPGEVLYVEVGGNGGNGSASSCAPGAGGFNGGGVAGSESSGCDSGGGGGGGASDVRATTAAQAGSLNSRIIVAGAGAGACAAFGGGSAGQAGLGPNPGQPGTSTAGGAGGGAGAGSGSLGNGGAGGNDSSANDPGGGGGGGLYGGGGGLNGAGLLSGCSGGGGGSSGFGSGATNASVAADTTGVPSVTFTYTPSSGGGGSGGGGSGSGGSGGSGSAGNGGSGSGGGSTSSFTVPHPRVSKTGVLTFSLTAPGAGTFTANATTVLPAGKAADIAKHHKKHKPMPISYGSGSVAAFRAGAVTLVVRPSGAAKAALAKGERLTVLLTIKFTPASGGTPTTHTMTVVVKGSKPGAKRRR